LAGEINTAMPRHVINRVGEALNACRKPVNGSKILVVGLAYKPNVDDDRESPSYLLMELLRERGADVSYYDPYVPVIKPSREHAHWAGTKSISWESGIVESMDVVLVATAHDCVNYKELADWSGCIVDTRNVMASIEVSPEKIWKA
jgi:UDP-N-acetyl-D-glucosamine dehydrogenase